MRESERKRTRVHEQESMNKLIYVRLTCVYIFHGSQHVYIFHGSQHVTQHNHLRKHSPENFDILFLFIVSEPAKSIIFNFALLMNAYFGNTASDIGRLVI